MSNQHDDEPAIPTGPGTAFEAGQYAALPRTVRSPEQYAMVPKGATLVSLEPFCEAPGRIRSEVTLHEAGAFSRYLNAFKDEDSIVFADRDGHKLLAILDYHRSGPPEQPRWGTHRASLVLRRTAAWVRWVTANGKRMDQVAFASHIEDNLPDIASPDGATLLEMVKNFEVKRAVAFSSAVRLDNGQVQFSYVEEGAGTAQKGQLTIPDRFVLGLAPFEGVEPYRIDARLRYRLAEGALALWYDLLRPEEYVKAAFESVVEFVEKQTNLGVYMGAV